MRYGGSKWKKPVKCDFCGIFYHLNGVKSKYKGLLIEKHHWKLLLRIFEVLQITLGKNPTCSFRDI